MKYKQITLCRACGGKLRDIISLGNQTSVGFTDKPTDGNKIPLDLVLCEKCKLLQLKHTTNPKLLFNENYGYRSGINDTMKGELADIVKHTKTAPGNIVIDIGCNDGTLLSNYPKCVTRVGFDPSLGENEIAKICKRNVSRGGAIHRLFDDFFNAGEFIKAFGDRKASVVTAIAMFYDLDDPNGFLQDIYEVIDDDGVLIIQQNYLVGMLENVAYDNVLHEHLEYFSLMAMVPLLDRNGFEIVDVGEREINGGSFRVYAKKINRDNKIKPTVYYMTKREREMGLGTMAPYMGFADKVKSSAKELRTLIEDIVIEREQTVYVYGASTRGNSLLQVCGLDHKLIAGAAERNPVKYGKYTAGTKIPIVSEAEARRKADYFLVLPWFFKTEFIERELRFLRKGGHLIFPLPEIKII